MRSRAGVALLAEYALRPLGNPLNRSQPAWRSTTLTSEKGAHVGQDGIAQVEHHLKWLESKYADAKHPANHLVLGKLRRTSATASPPSFIEPSGMRRWIVS
jgi:hypothetical protein